LNLTIKINRTFLQELGADLFFILIYCLAYYTKNEQVPTKKSICSELSISGKKVNDSLDLLFPKLEKDATNTVFIEYKFLLNSNLYSCYKNRKGKPEKIKSETLEEKVWNYVVKFASDYYPNQEMRNYYWWIGLKVRELIKRIKKERIKEYTAWWMKHKSERIERFGPGIFFYDGIIKEFMEKGHSSKANVISDRKGEFEKQAEAEAKEMLEYLLDLKEAKDGLTAEEEKLLAQMKEELE